MSHIKTDSCLMPNDSTAEKNLQILSCCIKQSPIQTPTMCTFIALSFQCEKKTKPLTNETYDRFTKVPFIHFPTLDRFCNFIDTVTLSIAN